MITKRKLKLKNTAMTTTTITTETLINDWTNLVDQNKKWISIFENRLKEDLTDKMIVILNCVYTVGISEDKTKALQLGSIDAQPVGYKDSHTLLKNARFVNTFTGDKNIKPEKAVQAYNFFTDMLAEEKTKLAHNEEILEKLKEKLANEA